MNKDTNNNHNFSFGALIYANSIESKAIIGKTYAPGFEDLNYEPIKAKQYRFVEANKAKHSKNSIQVRLLNKETNEIETLKLVPFGKTILRQAGF